MNLLDALQQIKELNISVLTSNDVATLLNITPSYASHTMRKLQQTGTVFRLKKSLWGLTGKLDRFALPGYLCAPMPTYISLHSALHIHGIIEQIPEVIYAVSTSQTHRYETEVAVVSIHHLHPDFFFGYAVSEDPMIKIATAEKALIDYLYLQPAKSKLFYALPEIDTSALSLDLAREYIEKIPYSKRRKMVESRFGQLTK